MTAQSNVLLKAQFNPKIKRYLLIYISLVFAITILGIILLPLVFIFAPLIIGRYFDRLSAELTSRALRFEKGVLFHVERTIPLDKIQDLNFKEGPLLRFFGLSILKVETAGGSGQGQADLTLIGIVDAANFRQRVLEQRDIVTDNQVSAPQTEDGETTLKVLKEIRDSLQKIEKNTSQQ